MTRTNDLYCRDMPSAKAIEEIKHLARVKRVKVGEIVHREHVLVRAIRDLAKTTPSATIDLVQIETLLKKHGLGTETA